MNEESRIIRFMKSTLPRSAHSAFSAVCQSKNVFMVLLALLFPAARAMAAPAYPLKTAPGRHYLVDANGNPFFVQGNSPWYLNNSISPSNVDFYLSNQVEMGYNSIILDMTAVPYEDGLNSETNWWGLLPFTKQIGGYTNLLSWNAAYFTNMDYIISRANHYGINCFCYPLYDGYDSQNGWYSYAMEGNPLTNLWQYGNFIGARYASYSNIVWIGAGDDNEPNSPAACLWNSIAAGILAADTNHLITAQAQRTTDAAAQYSAFCTLNATYPNEYTYIASLHNYQDIPTLASFSREAYYLTTPGTIYGFPTGVINTRQSTWWSICSGDCGGFYGDNINGWEFNSGWQTEMTNSGATAQVYARLLWQSRSWTNFVPDSGHSVCTAGYGTSGTIDYITTTRESHGYTVIAYYPQDTMSGTFAMNQIAGSTANAWWYNPSNGVATLIGSYATSGSQTFTAPSANDWALVLDDASQNYPPPGKTNAQAAPTLSWSTSSTITYGTALTTNQLNATASVPGSFAYNPTNGAVLNTGTNVLSVIFTPTDTVDYSSVTDAVSLVVSRAPLTVTAANATRSYGQANPAFTGTMTGLLNGDNITASYSCSATTGSPVGTYPITPALVDPANRQTNYTVSLINGALSIITAGESLTWASPAAITYGTALTTNQLNATASVPGSFAYNPTNGAVLNTGTNVLSVIFTPTDTVDYSSVTDAVSLVVSRAPLTVTAANATRSYGQANPAFTGTMTGLLNGDNITASYSCSATTGSPVGTYPITPALVDPANRQTNYTVSLINGALSIITAGESLTWASPAAITYGTALTTNQLNATASVPGSFAYNPTNGAVLNTGTNVLSVIFTPTDTVDYSSVTDAVSLVVSRAPLTVTAANATRSYGQANPAFTGTMTGLLNGDNITASYSCSATTGSPVGTYPITPALVDPANRQTNYTVSLINGALSIITAGESLTWASPAAITYGTALTTNQLNATASVPGSFAYNPTNGAVLNTGTNVLSVIFTPTDTVDYSSVTDAVSLVVSRAPLTVTAANATRSYGQANPAFTGTMTGLLNGDNITASYSCSATTGSPVGTYPITPALVDPANRQTNYTVSLINGALSITTAGESLTWASPAAITYGTALTTNQLNATASVPGSFAYNPTNGAVLNTGTNVLSVIFTPTDTVDYSSVTDAVSLVVSFASLTARVYPLRVALGQHYVVDANGNPFLIQGDSPWYLSECLSASNVDYYLSNRWAQGYNSVTLDITAQPVDDLLNQDTNFYGQHPFTGTLPGPYTNLLTWNVNYFTNVDWVIQRAAHYGICVFAYPLYDGYAAEGWYGQMAGNPATNLFQYGAFIGARYASFSNIVWIGGGDYNEPNAPNGCLWNQIAAGIKSKDTNHLIAAQAQRPTPASYYSQFITLNVSYPDCYSYVQSLANYQATPVMPSVCKEPYYENHPGLCSLTMIEALNCRQFNYWAVLSGDMGFFWGNENQWPFTTGWQGQMFDTASTTIPFLGQLLNTRLWYNLVPDAAHSVVIGGYGTSGTIDYVTTAREASGKTIVAYIPQDALTPTVAMTNVSGSTANAWWYNPRTGAPTLIATYATSGTETFVPPDTNDWVLVLDDASQNYPPPGQTNSKATPMLTWASPAAITYGTALTTNQLNATASVPGSFAYNPTNGAVLNTGTNVLSVIFTPTDTVDYSSVTDAVSLVVSRAPLTVTAANATRSYGQANPAFTGTMTGLLNGDNITASYSCSATTGSPVGTYPITPALVDPANRQTNYTVSLINGTLTITQRHARQTLEVTSGSGTLGIQALGGDMFQLNVAGVPGQTYTIQFTTDLNAPWRTLQSGTTDNSGTISFKVESTLSTGFYRFLH